MPIFKADVTTIPRALIRDKRLSVTARLVLIQFISHEEGASMECDEVAEALGIPEESAVAAVNELIELRYMLRVRIVSPGSTIDEIEVYDEPQPLLMGRAER